MGTVQCPPVEYFPRTWSAMAKGSTLRGLPPVPLQWLVFVFRPFESPVQLVAAARTPVTSSLVRVAFVRLPGISFFPIHPPDLVPPFVIYPLGNLFGLCNRHSPNDYTTDYSLDTLHSLHTIPLRLVSLNLFLSADAHLAFLYPPTPPSPSPRHGISWN